MKKQIKKIIFILILFSINVSLFAAVFVTDGYYWNYTETLQASSELVTLPITKSDLKYSNSRMNTPYKGYLMKQFTIDFSENSDNIANEYFEVFKDNKKYLELIKDGEYYYDTYDPNDMNYYWLGRLNISDSDGNKSTMSGFVKVTETNVTTNSSTVIWIDVTHKSSVSLDDSSLFGDITNQKFTFEYYFIINNIDELDPALDWTINSPSPDISSSNYPTVQTKIKDGFSDWNINAGNYDITKVPPTNTTAAILNDSTNNYQYIMNSAYIYNTTMNVDNPNSISDVYNLKITIEKKFDDSTDNFFDGELHDYYSLDFDSYKYGLLTEEPFSLALQISSAHNWFLYLDNEENPSDTEKVEYELYLKYNPNSSSSNFLIKDNQDKILINNIKSSSSSSTLFLQTKSDSATVSGTTKGEYQDTVYLNFITDGWTDSSENSFAEKVITLY